MSAKITMTIDGATQIASLFRSMPPVLQREVRHAIRETTHAVERGAQMRAPISSGGRSSRKARYRPGPGELRDTIRSEFTADGLVGFVRAGHGKLRRRIKGATSKRKSSRRRAAKIVTARKAAGAQRDRGVYAMVVEYGSPRERKAPQPFLRPALEAEKPRHRQRMEAAVARATQHVERFANRGGGRAA